MCQTRKMKKIQWFLVQMFCTRAAFNIAVKGGTSLPWIPTASHTRRDVQSGKNDVAFSTQTRQSWLYSYSKTGQRY